MGRKRQATSPPEALEPEQDNKGSESPQSGTDGVPAAKEHKLSDVIRAALGALGEDGNTASVKNWIAQNYPGWKYNEDSLASSVSTIKKKLFGGETTPRATTARATTSSEPTLADLFRVREIAGENGGAEELLKMVQTVHDLSADVGGTDKLLRCLEALHKLAS